MIRLAGSGVPDRFMIPKSSIKEIFDRLSLALYNGFFYKIFVVCFHL